MVLTAGQRLTDPPYPGSLRRNHSHSSTRTKKLPVASRAYGNFDTENDAVNEPGYGGSVSRCPAVRTIVEVGELISCLTSFANDQSRNSIRYDPQPKTCYQLRDREKANSESHADASVIRRVGLPVGLCRHFNML